MDMPELPGGPGDGPIDSGGSTYVTVEGTNFRMSVADQILYPRFTEMIKNLGNFVNNSRSNSCSHSIYPPFSYTDYRAIDIWKGP